MICKKCEKFFSVSGEQTGSEAVCPNCSTAQMVENTVVECVCPGCKQQLQFEAWMEGESAQCPSCGSPMELKRPAAPKVAPVIPRFRTSASNAPAAPPAPPAPAPAVPPVPPVSAPAPAVVAAEAAEAVPEVAAPAVSVPDKSIVSEAAAIAGKLTGSSGQKSSTPTAPRKKRKITVPVKYAKIAGIAAGALLLLLVALGIKSLIFPSAQKRLPKLVGYIANNQQDKLKSELESMAKQDRKIVAKRLIDECLQSKNQEMLKMILSGKYVNAGKKIRDDKSLFDFAAEPDGKWLTDVFIQSGTDLNVRLSDGSTLLERALKSGNAGDVARLLDNGADANTCDAKGQPLVFRTIGDGNLLKLFVEHKLDLNIRDRQLNTLLHEAVKKEKFDEAVYLLEKGVDPAATNNVCDTALLIHLRQNKGRTPFFNILIKKKCGVNTVNLKRESALSVVLATKKFDLINSLLNAGLSRNSEALKEIPVNNKSLKDSIEKQLAKLNADKAAEDAPALKNLAVTEFVKAYNKEPFAISWTHLIIWLVWIISGYFSLRLLMKEEKPLMDGAFNLLAFFAGPVPGIIYFGISGSKKMVKMVQSRIDAKMAAKLSTVRFFNPQNEDCSKAASAESDALLNLCRSVFLKAVELSCDTIIFNPSPNGYSIVGQLDGQEAPIRRIPADMGRKTMVILKNLAGLDPYEESAPQNGFFTVQNRKQLNRVVISTVGLGTIGERALLTIKAPEDNITSYRQLPVPKASLQPLAELFKAQRGLLIVTGSEKSACAALVAMLLENSAAEIGNTVWIGDGSEPAGPPEVPRIKADPIAHVTAEQLLAALPDCKAAGITIADGGDKASMNYAVRAAGQKLVILVMNSINGAEAVKLLMSAGVNNAELQSVLKLIITPLKLHKLCRCAVPDTLPEDLSAVFAALSLPADKLRKKNGCPECAQTGEDRGMTLYDTVVPSATWLASPAVDALPVSQISAYVMASRGVADISEVRSCFAKFGGCEK